MSASPRKIGVVTVARSDYSLLKPILFEMQSVQLDFELYVSGTHLVESFGKTVDIIRQDGFPITEEVDARVDSDTGRGVAKSISLALSGFAEVLDRRHPDLLLVLGDRFEMYAAALAALPLRIPVAHVHGGELTFGAMDDALRHSMTKLGHLHFTSTEEYRQRVVQLGEDPKRVFVTGAPGLDNIRRESEAGLMMAREFYAATGAPLDREMLLITYHPETVTAQESERRFLNLLAAADATRRPVLVTMPNTDMGSETIRRHIRDFAASHPDASVVENLGDRAYYSAMSAVRVIVGNSSSGIIEAACFKTPVVNVGTRQAGRMRPSNVIDALDDAEEIFRSIKRAASDEFRATLRNLVNPFGDGYAAGRIVEVLRDVELGEKLLFKRFHDMEGINA